MTAMNTKTENTDAQASWFDGASYGGTDDQMPRFAFCTGILQKTLQGQMVVLGDMNLGGSIIPVENLAECLQAAFDSGAKRSRTGRAHRPFPRALRAGRR